MRCCAPAAKSLVADARKAGTEVLTGASGSAMSGSFYARSDRAHAR